ncbi:MAG: ABC transporter ATP-binding protein [Fimbriimonadaceae bacterium]|nr:ABC transporter ATP-binding protein [Fimbriimonadaceae bacterium]
MALLSAQELGKRFGARWLFRRVEFDLEIGDSLLLTGANGSGKSTLLRVLAGLISPSEGKVGRPEHIGYAALDQSLYPALSAAEHLTWAAEQRGIEPNIDLWMERTGLTDRKQVVGTYSTGMRGRLKLALAFQAAPSLVLLDEPSVALDEGGIGLLTELLAEQKGRGAMVIATNNQEDLRFGTAKLELGT